MDTVSRIEQMESDLDALVERRAAERKKANQEAKAWHAEVADYHQRRRLRNLEAWCSFYQRLAASHRKLSCDFEAKARQLLAGEADI